jgi:hypothetical protein
MSTRSCEYKKPPSTLTCHVSMLFTNLTYSYEDRALSNCQNLTGRAPGLSELQGIKQHPYLKRYPYLWQLVPKLLLLYTKLLISLLQLSTHLYHTPLYSSQPILALLRPTLKQRSPPLNHPLIPLTPTHTRPPKRITTRQSIHTIKRLR